MLTEGQQVTRYRLDHRLESDGLMEAWHATFVTTAVPRVLRVAKPEAEAHFDEWTKVLRHQQRVTHPGRTDVIDVMKVEGRPTAVLDLKKGPSLTTWSRARPRKVGEIVLVFAQLVAALRTGHKAGILHGSIDARRVIMCNDKGPFVPKLDLAHGQLAAHYALGIRCPEAGTRPLDERSDLYQLGTVLYEIIVRAPYTTEPGAKTIEEARPDAPPQLRELAEAMLRPDPGARPQSTTEVVAALSPLKDLVNEPPPVVI